MITVRPATKSDHARYVALNREVQEMHARAWPGLFKPAEGFEVPRAEFEAILDNASNLFLFAEEAGEACGYVYAEIVEKPETPFRFAQRCLLVHQIGVRQDKQRQGIGRLLMERVLQIGKEQGCGRAELTYWSFNDQAGAFYSALGMQTVLKRASMDL